MKTDLQVFLQALTTEPGVYLMKDASGQLLYVGKAKCLKKRVASYFSQRHQDSKTTALVARIDHIDIMVTQTAHEALLLEDQLIKRYHPPYNISFRDDKTYPYLVISRDTFPYIAFRHRKSAQQNVTYFGPYTSAGAMKALSLVIQKLFGLRTCSNRVFRSMHRPCLKYQLGRCLAPCTGCVSEADYIESVRLAQLFLQGNHRRVKQILTGCMQMASRQQQYELAARYRDQIKQLKIAHETVAAFGQSPNRHYTSTIDWQQRFCDLQMALGLKSVPTQIECFDISHHQGDQTVASCVVFNQTGISKSDYRQFNIQDVARGDDAAALQQALSRRYRDEEWPKDYQGPIIILIDGGKGQLNAVYAVLRSLQVSDSMILLGIAKDKHRQSGLETIYRFKQRGAVAMEHYPDAFLLLQHIRDEAHRFAITCHRKKRSKRMKRSSLEAIPGIGPSRRRALLNHFGGLQEIKQANISDLTAVKGITSALAQRIFDYCRQL